MKKNYLFENLFESFFNQSLFTSMEFKEPEENDENFNKEVNEIENETHKIKTEEWTSIDGTLKYRKTIFESKKTNNDLKLEDLKSQMKIAIEKEDFERAAVLRDEINSIKNK